MSTVDTMPDRQIRHEKELEALREIARVLGRSSGRERMLHEVLEVVEGMLGFSRSTIMLLSPDGGKLVVGAVHREARAVASRATYSRGEGITGQVLQSGTPAVIPRISEEPRFRGLVHDRSEGTPRDYSFICVPVTVGQETVGTLSSDFPQSDEESLREALRVLEIVAGLVAHDLRSRRRARQERRILEEENLRLRGELSGCYRPENIVGNSHAMQAVYRRIEQVASADTTVLIRGPSGTGKELVASAIHYASRRAREPLVKVNCATLSESVLESELFGHERGSFTGATGARVGRVEQANGGTLFLDEIGDFSPTVQVKLLRVLQEREFERLGSNEVRSADVRILAATNRDLEADIAAGTFREDLYYRINVFPIQLPALADRRDDILLLAEHFVAKYAERMGRSVRRISSTAIDMMMAYHWPGNVRELENCIEHAVLLCDGEVIRGTMLPPTLQMPSDESDAPAGSLKERVTLLEREMIVDALKRGGGNCATAAQELGITPRMVRYKVKNLGLERYTNRMHS